jgi:hypothetical protein
MRSFFIIAALVGTYAAASPAARSPTDPSIVRTGDVPTCVVSGGHTVVNYSPSFHTGFKCAHTGATCACTLHPTHQKGGCKEIVGTNGVSVQHAGDCTDSGLNPPPSNVEITNAADGAVINLPAGIHKWDNEVRCWGKTLTVIGAGKGVTIIDAARQDTPNANGVYETRSIARASHTWLNDNTSGQSRHFVVSTGCKLILKGVTLINANSHRPSGWLVGGSIMVCQNGILEATDVEFKDNYAVRAHPLRTPPAAL